MELFFLVKHATSGVNDWLARTRDGRVYTPAPYKAFVNEITSQAVLTMAKLKMSTIKEPVNVSVFAYIKNKRKDIDNFVKPVLDALQKGGVIENDNQVMILHVEKCTEMETEVDTLAIKIETL